MVQTAEDGTDYVCAYASTGLSPAQRNYHIVRLELLAFVYACGKFYDWLAGISFVWRSDCRAHEFLHKAKFSSNSTIARYALTLSEFQFRTEWIPGIKMIADSFSRIVLAPAIAPGEALTLPEIVFGQNLGSRLAAAQRHKIHSPLLFYQPVMTSIINVPFAVEIDEIYDGWQTIPVTLRAEVPVTQPTWDPRDCILQRLPDIPLMATEVAGDSDDPTPVLEEMDVWPPLTTKESRRLAALPHLRQWVQSKTIDPSLESLRPVLKELSRNLTWDGTSLWKVVNNARLEVLDDPERLRTVL